jgi:hypothetical protein
VREAWRALRGLPRYRIVRARRPAGAGSLSRADGALHLLLIVITIDWYDGVIRLSDTFFRQIAIDGRYRDFPIWSFVIPSVVLMAWKTMTVLRKETVPRHERFAKALSFGRLLGYDGSGGFVRMDKSFQPGCAGAGRNRCLPRC